MVDWCRDEGVEIWSLLQIAHVAVRLCAVVVLEDHLPDRRQRGPVPSAERHGSDVAIGVVLVLALLAWRGAAFDLLTSDEYYRMIGPGTIPAQSEAIACSP